MKLDYEKISDLEFDGIKYWDAPKFCDAFVSAATYDGREMSEEELDILNKDSIYVYKALIKHLY